MATKYPHPTAPHRLTLDPNSRGTIIRYALGIESVLNLIFGALLFLYPTSVLEFLVSDHSLITPLSTSIVQIIAALIFALSIPMAFAVPNTRRGIEMRAPMYYYMGGAEVFLTGLFAYFAFVKSEGETGLSADALVTLMVNLAPPLAFRAFVLWVKPGWIGKYADGGAKGE
ncbi:hypothetical protein K505DRAFT_227735 [Melanomma pulvis-pyrius CBS 109.77]|uniref:Uncharacterized protein n=1 Tax=Melanomma pulvis-pyrius CBS 109.77 TaxID=1314802 RepID=A0A6A6XWP9_9PLEO|nr:hypothetical protein K505DRAFT_227735 [Melanomma pulvis-pyrius CBS 109.77]